MAPALQCPACGFKHRLDAVADTPVFPCARCSRQLKVPGQFRTGAAPVSPSRPATPRTARADGATRPAAGRPRNAAGSSRSSIKDWRPSGEPMRLPIRIILWLVAFVLSAFIVRSFAKWTGIAGSQQLLDSMIDKGFGTYFRLFILVPIWGLFATILATAFIDGPAWWARRSVQPAPPRNRTVPAATGAAAAASGQKAVSKPGARKVPTRPPSRAAAPAPAPAPVPAPRAEPTRPVPDQRPRRIPRRDTGS